jgi:predicted metal-binding membrane protein
MILSTQERTRVTTTVLLISLVTWMMLLVTPGSIMTLAHCPATDSGASLVSFRMLLAMNPISSLTTGWALMLVAMMSPMLITPIHHIRERSFKRRRARAVTLFVIGYAAIWMAAGGVLIAVRLMLNLLVPQSYLPSVMVGIIAFVWQCSPIKQRCLNRGHNHSELAAFGIAADLDALRFGVTHGVWCVGSCWALMLLPMLLSQGHFAGMAAVTFVMTSERLEQPRRLSWRLRFPGKLMRIAITQTRIRLQSLPSGIRPSLAVWRKLF